MGTPTAEQRAAILARSGLETLCAPEQAEVHAGKLEICFPLPVHGISLLEIRPLSPETGEADKA